MINLVPPHASRRIVTEYWVRAVSVWLLLAAAAAAAGAIFLLPPYVLVTDMVKARQQDAAAEKTPSLDVSERELAQANTLALALVEEDRSPRFTDVVYIIDALQGPDISISSYEFSRSGADIAPVRITGVAKNRQSLASFRAKLLDSPRIVEVDLPISNLAAVRDIDFSLTIIVATSTPAT
jgi:hypothetical protein